MDPSPESSDSSPLPLPESTSVDATSGSAPIPVGAVVSEGSGYSEIPGPSASDDSFGAWLSVLVSWSAIALATLVLTGGVYYDQFLAEPKPVEKLPAAAEMQLRSVIGLDGMGQVDTTEQTLKDMTEEGPVVQRMAGVLVQVEVDDAEAAAETLESIQLEIVDSDYQPEEFEQELLDATYRVVQDQRFQAQKKEAEKKANADPLNDTATVESADGSTEDERTIPETSDSETEATPGDDEKLSTAAGESRIILDPPTAGEPEQLQADLELFKERLGIVGELASTWYADSPKPGKELKQRIQYSIFGLVGFALIALLALLLGMVFLVTLLVLFGSGQLSTRMQVPGVFSHIYLEGFAVWMTLFVASQLGLAIVLGAFSIGKPGPLANGVLTVVLFYGPMILGVIWVLARHPQRSVAVKQIGFRSDGILSDMVHGVLTYISFLPIIGLAMLTTVFLTSLSGAEDSAHPFQAGRGPSHPISEQFGGSIWSLLFLYFVAAISAPIVEEIVFRGLLFRWLRDALVNSSNLFAQVVHEAFPEQMNPDRLASTFGILVAAVINSFIFAAIHPQGLLGIPALMSIGICMSYARAWRGGLIAPMTIHALHNGSLVTMMAIMNL